MTEFINTAKYFAVAAHAAVKQKRKYTGEDYYWHCYNVADIVQRNGGTETMIAAAWLHDTVEDAGVTIELIEECFGSRVAGYVEALTDREEGNRKERKRLACIRLGNACAEVQTIELADLIDNTSTVVRYDHAFANTYMQEKRDLLEVLTKGDAKLYAIAKSFVDDYFEKEGKT